MKVYKCKCGSCTSWSSMGHQPCEGCDKCGTTFAQHPGDHKQKEPHEWTTETTYTDGKLTRTRTYCKRCHASKPPEDNE